MKPITYQDVQHFRCNDLRRWKVCFGRWLSIRLHHWVAGDPEQYQHAHPWNFLTLVFTGGYDDVGEGRPTDHVRAPAVRYRTLNWRHSVTNVRPGTWSLVITGHVVRPWLFWIGKRQVEEEEWNARGC